MLTQLFRFRIIGLITWRLLVVGRLVVVIRLLFIITWLLMMIVDRGVLDGSLSIDSIKYGCGQRIQQFIVRSNWLRILFLNNNIRTIEPLTWRFLEVGRLAGVIGHPSWLT